ncbi:MAG: hypothetical protein NZ108_00545 [Bacteroidia bacterium]|nr:hypothetical protein [Bacteroidia bacterium]
MLVFHQQLREVLLRHLRGSNSNELFLCVPWFSDEQLFQEIRLLAQTGIKIELATRKEVPRRSWRVEELAIVGVTIYWLNQTEEYPTFLVGSPYVVHGNYTWETESTFGEVLIVAESTELVRQYLLRFRGICAMADVFICRPNLPGDAAADLKAEIYWLEAEIELLLGQQEDLKQFYLQMLDRCDAELGDLLLQKADLQAQIAQKRAEKSQQPIDEAEAASWQEQYQQTKERLKNMNRQEKEPIPSDLRAIYLQAIRKAHPDQYASEPEKFKLATEITARLTEAYRRRDYDLIQTIVFELEKGLSDKLLFDQETTIERLYKWQYQLKKQRKQIIEELQAMRKSSLYSVFKAEISSDDYLLQIREQLKRDVVILEQVLTELIS